MTAGPPVLRVGVVGYGVMGRAHCLGYRVAPLLRALPVTPVVTVMSGRDRDAVARAAASCGVPEYTTEWRGLVERADVDLVDICTPPGTHALIAQAAAAAGKAVLCEKPLALDYREAMAATEAVESAGVPNAVGFNYRRLPAVALMRRMIADGAIGDVRLWRGTWLSDEFTDPATPYDWRFDRGMGGTTIADLGCHLIDLATWMAGPITDVCAQSQTFIARRSLPAGGDREVTVDDASSALVRFASGARGTVEMARSAVRRPCDVTVEFNGSRGTLVFDYPRLNELRFGDGDDDPGLYGMRRIRAEHPTHPYAAQWWPIGQGVGYGASFANQVADLLERWPDGRWVPGFREAAAVQAVCDAMELSAAQRRWVSVSEVTAGASVIAG
ncbi:MAG TPA: Gfo/Idh/MocA family oxidoreductase [Streptosporangiaceae bacterium]|nr:Gfo/Idh/MocA family oxidoreductase [Streptosporangiaceae bacterium]